MEIYLPIAEQSMNVFVLLGLGAAAGLLAGMFGVGGGFLATPLLIFVGLLPWTYFSGCLGGASNSVVTSSNLLTKVYFPRLILPLTVRGQVV